MDRFESMSVFVSVVDEGGFSAASRRLAKPLATVSRRVSELEEQLGLLLLNRSTRHVTLTDSGRQYYEACRKILNDLDEAERVAAGEYQSPKGELIVTAPIVFGRLHIVPLITELMGEYRELDVRLVLVDRVVSLLEESADVAVRIGALADSSLVATRVGATTRVITASPEYLAKRSPPKKLEDLQDHDCIKVMALPPPNGWLVRSQRKDVVVPVKPRLAVTTAEAGIEAALSGGGVVQTLCYQVSDLVRAGRLVMVMPEHEPKHLPISLVYARGKLVPAKLRAFLDFMAPRLRERLSQSLDC